MRDIYINSNLKPISKFTSSSRSTDYIDILPWNISQMIIKTVPISTRIVISYAMKLGISLWIWWSRSTTWSRFPNGGKAIVDQILASEERNKTKWPGLLESQSGIRVGKLTILVRLPEIITEFPRCISFTRIGYLVLMMDVKV